MCRHEAKTVWNAILFPFVLNKRWETCLFYPSKQSLGLTGFYGILKSVQLSGINFQKFLQIQRNPNIPTIASNTFLFPNPLFWHVSRSLTKHIFSLAPHIYIFFPKKNKEKAFWNIFLGGNLFFHLKKKKFFLRTIL